MWTINALLLLFYGLFCSLWFCFYCCWFVFVGPNLPLLSHGSSKPTFYFLPPPNPTLLVLQPFFTLTIKQNRSTFDSSLAGQIFPKPQGTFCRVFLCFQTWQEGKCMQFFFSVCMSNCACLKKAAMMPIVDKVSGDKISSTKTKSFAANHSVCYRSLC